MNATMAAASSTGRRSQNQDDFCIAPELGLCVVADGMGGYAGGEIASQTAVESIRHFYKANRKDGGITWPFAMQRELTLAENMASVSIRLAHRAICARRRGPLSQMGTTVVVAALAEDDVVLAHVGDSRIYRLRDGELEQMTRDHSMYNELFDAGCSDLPPEREFRHKNVVSRALGFSKEDDEQPQMRRETARPGDLFLLCTDGVHDVLGPEEIRALLGENEPKAACHALVEAAYAAGSTDNITAAVLHIDP